MSSVTTTVKTPRKRKYGGVVARGTKRLRPTPLFVNPPVRIPISRGPCPSTITIKLRYFEIWNSDGTIIDYRFRTNSLYDPNRTATGHQPLGRDQWATFYDRYRVTKCYYQIDCTNVSTSAGSIVSVLHNTDDAAVTNAGTAAEQALCVTRQVPPSSTRRFVGVVHPHVVWGVTAKQYNDDDVYAAQMGSNPGSSSMMHIVHCDDVSGGVLSAAQLRVTVKMWMTANLFAPLAVASS